MLVIPYVRACSVMADEVLHINSRAKMPRQTFTGYALLWIILTLASWCKSKMTKYLFAASFIFICSCNSWKNNKTEQNASALYNLALESTTGSDTILRYHLRIPPMPKDIDWDTKRLEKFKHWRDSLLAILDTAEIYVVVNHKKTILDSSVVQNIIKIITAKKTPPGFKMNGDTSFNEALRDLCNNRLVIDTIRVKDLKTKFNYKIYSDRNFPKDRTRKLGAVIFSKIGYSEKRDKSAIYTIFICGSHCGSEQILFFEKEQGMWKYKKEWRMGVF